MKYIKDIQLRKSLLDELKTKTRNQIVNEIKQKGCSFHQYHIDRFVSGGDVKLSTLKKIDNYLNKE